MGHKAMPRGKKLFPGHAASPVPCGMVVFHGDEPSFTTGSLQSFSAEMSMLVRATIHGSEWWKRKRTLRASGHSTLNRRILVLNRLGETLELESLATTVHFLPNPHQSNVPTGVISIS